jgi:3-oxoadipate enol-lactonase
MAHASIDGHEIFYDRGGTGEPLLLVMGMAGTHRTWGEPFVEALREDFDAVVYDHRGIGLSSHAEAGFSIAALADDAAALLDELGWESAHVVGISMGGMVAQELALRHAERVRTLTLGCTYAGGPGSALTSEAVAGRLGSAWTSGDRELAIRAGWEANVSAAFAGDDAGYAAFRKQALAVKAPLPTIFAQLQAINGHDTSARLGEIEAPTLIVHGTDDEMLPVGNARAIAERMPRARLELFEGVGHLFFWERPADSARLVREHALAARA